MPSTHNGKIIKTREAYEREFERYLVRLTMERHPKTIAAFLWAIAEGGYLAENSPIHEEALSLAALSLTGTDQLKWVGEITQRLKRPPNDEELLVLAKHPQNAALGKTLQSAANRERIVTSLIRLASKLDAAALSPLLTDVARQLWSADEKARQLATQLVTAFRLTAFESDLVAALERPDAVQQVITLKALREIGTSQDDVLSKLAKSPKDRNVRHEAILTLASSKSERAPAMVVDLWPEMNALQRRLALERITTSKPGATALLASINSGAFPKSDLDATTLDKLNAVLPNNPKLAKLTEELTALYQPVLRLDGKNDSYVDTHLTLDGPFTVETWIKLAPSIDNNDGILGAQGVLDMNFYDARFRVWTAGGDVIVAKKKMAPDSWTHIATTRDDAGKFTIYLNGELDTADSKPASQKFDQLKIGWTAPARGTDGWLTQFRVWNYARSAEDIRAAFDQTFEGETKPDGLIQYYKGANWPKLLGSARIEKTDDLPPILNAMEAKAAADKLAKFHTLAQTNGDLARGKTLFTLTCQTCHTVSGQGGQIGPVLNGAAANGLETLLRALLTPNAAMEAGYRTFRVELKDGDVLDGFLVSQNDEAIVLRQPNAQDRRIPQDEVRRARYTKTSLMPEGLLEALPEKDATDLLAYLKTLK